MPIFEFRCHQCGKEFERIVFSSGEANVTCPQCGSESTERIMSVFACAASPKMDGGPSLSKPSHSSGCS
jgi:putative FmdB family regulatory protein